MNIKDEATATLTAELRRRGLAVVVFQPGDMAGFGNPKMSLGERLADVRKPLEDRRAQHTPGPWRPLTVKASKARAATRHWIKGPEGHTVGWFPSAQAAQDECERRNAALAKATGGA